MIGAILALLLLTVSSFGALSPAQGIRFAPLAAAGGACATANYGTFDEMLYGWESGDAPGGTWTGPTDIIDTGVDSITYDTTYDTSALTTGKPTGACNVGLRCTLTGTAGFDSKRFDRGSTVAAGTAIDLEFHIYVQANLSSSRIGIFTGGQNPDPTGGNSFTVEFQTDSVPQVRGSGDTDSEWQSLTANSWNRVRIHIDATAANSTITVNSGSAAGFTSSSVSGVRYIYVGGNAVGAGLTGQFVIDLTAAATP